MQTVTSRVFATYDPLQSCFTSPVNTAYSKLFQRARFPEAGVRNMFYAQIAHFILMKTNMLYLVQGETFVTQSAIFVQAALNTMISNIIDDFNGN